MKPRLLDLFCGAGGAAMGYARAGFEVVGVDIKPQPRYPFEFVQHDALNFLALRDLEEGCIDAIHASPPCQAYSVANNIHQKDHPDLLPATRELLERGHVIRKTPAGNNTTRRRHTTTERGREAMGIDWMTRDELSEAIPPAYTEFIGTQLMAHLKATVAA